MTQPKNVVASEQLRLNVAIPPTMNQNRLGVLGGDNQGYPNGRRLADDVIDISLRAVAGAAYPLFHSSFTPDATGLKLGDGVDKNDTAFRARFPYMALPNRGLESIAHGNYSNTSTPTRPRPPIEEAPTALIICNITYPMMIGASGWDVGCLQQFLIDK